MSITTQVDVKNFDSNIKEKVSYTVYTHWGYDLMKEPITVENKETVLVSLCAFGVPCRYHGQSYKMGMFLYKEKHTEELRKKYNILPLCGALMGGLPTPRPPCVVEESPEGLQVIGRNDRSINYTDQYNKGASEVLRLAKIFNIKKAYLLKDCPMCGKDYGILARLLTKEGIPVYDV